MNSSISGYIKLVAVMAVFFLYGCGAQKDDSSGKTVRTVADTVAVETTPVELHDLKVVKTYSGSLEGESQANIVAKISERIIAIPAQVGQMVKAGQPLVSLDKAGASSQYYQAEANYQNARKNLDRMKSLFEEGAISQQSLDGYQTNFEVAKANYEAAKSAVELTAPISGVITAVNASIGDLATPGSPLVTIAKISEMKIIFDVSEFEIQHLAPGQAVRVYSEFRPELEVTGRITQLARSADVRSRSFEVKALFPNTKDYWFKPGMFCKVRVELESANNVAAIPSAAILTNGDSNTVFVVQKGRAFSHKIRTGLVSDSLTEVVQGLEKGENLVIRGMNNLQDGVQVMVVNSDGKQN